MMVVLENAILFVGLGNNRFKLDEIIQMASLDAVEAAYGEGSCFYKAAKNALTFSSKDMYFLNLDSWERIKYHAREIADLDIDYLVPLNLYLDETYYDDFYDKTLSFTQLILSFLSNTVTTVIMTGKHASNYEDLDSFLDEESRRIENVQPELVNVNKENLIYVANNLKGIDFANALLASLLIETDYGEYPRSSSLPEAVFEIDFSDVENELAYFKNNHLVETTVENLVNFSIDHTTKPVTVKRILKYFHFHRPDNLKYIGKAYSEYKKVMIAEELDEFLAKLVGWLIYKYDIYSVSDVSYEPGSVDIILKYDIWPKFTTERITLEYGN